MMTTTTTTTRTECGGLPRFTTEEDYEATFGTPRPTMNTVEMTERQDAAKKAILSFSQVVKYAAAASKRRRSPKSRTDYSLMNNHVIRAFKDLESQIKQNPAIMSQADFNLLKQAIANIRVRLIVHDSISFHELKLLHAETSRQQEEAEKAAHAALNDKAPDSDQRYFNAKDRLFDLTEWSAELAKEIRRIEPKFKYNSSNTGLFRFDDLNKPTAVVAAAADPPGVPSQHAHVAHATGVMLRNILSPETIRRTFISLQMLTRKIREELVRFLINAEHHKDRHEVIKQIKECVMAAKKKAAADAHSRLHQ
jgi:hypothetical protein